MPRKKTPISFEKSMTELEGIVDTLESGKLSLEDSLKVFEQGVVLTQECQKALTQAEQKVVQLTELHQKASFEPFSLDEGEDELDED